MTAINLDENAALVVIDLQKGIVALPTISPADEVVRNAARLASAFRRVGRPVILVNVAGSPPGRTAGAPPRGGARPDDWADLVPELDAQPADCLITKHGWSAFENTSLHDHLQARNVTQIVLCGIATSIGVESTARQAYDLGYNVLVVSDAVTDLNADAHVNCLERIIPRLGEVSTCDELEMGVSV